MGGSPSREPLTRVLAPDSHITIIPTGLISLLPLHAAWTRDGAAPTGKRFALDIFTISYAPNAGALIKSTAIEERIRTDAILAIEDPMFPPTQENMRLVNSRYEVESVVSTFSENRRRILRREQATREAVLKALPHYPVVLFSCHGSADFNEPVNSGLMMANHEPLTLKELFELRLSGVRLATLSACETGIPGVTLPDEFINPPSTLLQAGVAGVVASLWSVSDLDAMMLMTRFYDNWRSKSMTPVEALRQAQIWLRDSNTEEKHRYFEALANARPGETKISHETLKGVRQEFES